MATLATYFAVFAENFSATSLLISVSVLSSVFLLRKFSRSDKSCNPFKEDARRPPEPLVIDKDARNKVLKKGAAFSVEKVPSDLDAIVIGSGPGGLTTADILRKSGKHGAGSGAAWETRRLSHTFGLKGLQFDCGIHYVGKMEDSSTVRVLLDQITEGQLQWASLDDDYDVAVLGEPDQMRWVPIRCGRQQYKQELLQHFPGEEQAIEMFLKKTKEVADGADILGVLKILPLWLCKVLVKTGIVHVLNSFFRYMSRSTKEVLDELTDNAGLKTVFAHNFGDHGVLPSKSGFALQASLAEHFRDGGYYPVGGASEIAFHIIPVIKKAGGAVLCRAPVSQILIDNDGRATGVRVQDKKVGEVDIHAPVIVSATGVYNTYHNLLPTEVAQNTGLGDVLKAVSQSCSCLSVFVGLRGTKEELGLKAQNIWLFAGNDMERLQEEYSSLTPEEASEADPPVLFISFPSAKDPSWEQRCSPERSTCTILNFSIPPAWFERWNDECVKHRSDEYQHLKQAIGQHMWEQTCRLFPELQDKVEFIEVATSISNNHYINVSHGEIYGLEHCRTRCSAEMALKLRPETPVPGLFLTGQDIFLTGFVGSVFSGVFTAGAVLERYVIQDLWNLCKKIKDKKTQ
ncbi:all-trans-retinol 13,14-reductase-like [Branchiostoma floridae]|uniref:All-trans-retinol 13,14-reductase-like n=1 Tax=Branchiostoma floridae TaxID=7739 RepID=A0A9J7LVP4_BRAFL|nr:all-trans-retinol 13,14-reductase-like [Branchiostoma floridae]